MSLLSRLVNVSVKVPEEVRRLMKRVNVNWSEYLRRIIEAKIREEIAKEVAEKLDEIRRRSDEVSTKEIVKWIREDREKSLE
ncbi:MAG: hypothetical protein QXL27_05495 [Candidatus Bathyarchaeia archaeon]